jgi:uncharacterized protein YutE (UPF0331/DUF86 family)
LPEDRRRKEGQPGASPVIDRRLVRAKLDAIVLYLERLAPLAGLTSEAFTGDYRNFNLAERNVQLAVDAAVDVNNHILLEAGRPAPPDYYSSFLALATLRVLPRPKAEALARTTGLRNRIVHAYEAVDLKIVHRGLREFIRLYRGYCTAVRRFARA